MATAQPLPDLSETYQPALLTAEIITFTLAAICVVLRFIARRLIRLKYWLDDWLIVAGLVSGTACFALILHWIKLGLGLHFEVIEEPFGTIFADNIFYLFIAELIYSTTTVLVKLSILAFYWRIFQIHSIRLPIKIMAAAAIAWLIARIFAIVFHCIPVAYYWDKTLTGTCGVSDKEFFFGTNTINLLMDVIILTLPMPYIGQLHMKKSLKFIVAGIFLLGGFVSIASIMFLVVTYQMDQTSPDVTWTFSPIVLWAGTEINLGIVCACLPSLRPIFLLITKGSPTADTRAGSRLPGHTGPGSKTNQTVGSKRCARRLFSPSGARSSNLGFSTFDEESSNINLSRDDWGSTNKNDHVIMTDTIPLDRVHMRPDKITVQKEIRVNYADHGGV